MDLCHIISSYS
uniref:Uncharacterized protein n=1 Tax=Anguilla anguilla TaxID=7936 RepID=A0A0E9PPQ0_ANGAN